MRLSRWVVVISVVAFALLIVDVAVSTYNVDTLSVNDRAVGQSREISRALAEILSNVTAGETGQRGYLITGERSYLGPLTRAERDLPDNLDRLRDLTAGDPFYVERVPRLTALVRERLAQLREVVGLFDGPGREAARQAILTGHGKTTMDAIRTLADEMETHGDDVLNRRAATAHAGYQLAKGYALFGGILTIVIMGAAFVVVQRELARRQRAEIEARQAAADLAESQRETTESLALLDAFLENAPIGMAFFDTDLRYLRINEHLAAANGRAVAEHVGRHVLEAVPDLPAPIVADLKEVAATRRPLLNREAAGRPGGVERVWLTSYFPVSTRDGRAIGVGVVAQDVTERLAAVRRLRESEARKTAILETALDCIVSIDHAGRITEFNPAAEHTFGPARSDVIEKADARTFIPGLPLDESLVNRRVEVTARRADGTEFPAELSVSAIRVGDEPLFTVYLRDITDRKRAEDALRHSLDRFRTLVEAVPQMVFVADPGGLIASANGRWVEYTGFTPREAPDWTAALHPDDVEPVRSAWQAAIETAPDRFTHECRVRAADGSFRWMLVTAVPLRSAGGVVSQWVATLTDIDDQKRQREILAALVRMRTGELESANQLLRDEIEERRRAEDRARAAAVELGRSNEELEKFAYVASHDLQEPLRKIQAFGDRLAKKFRDAVGPDGQDYIDRMKASASRMRTLIDDLLSFSRVTTKAQPFAQVSLGEIVAEVLSDLEVRINQTGAHVEVGELPTLAGDPLQMRQLFQNLVGNALKFQKPGVPPVVTIGAVPWPALPPDADPPPPTGTGWRITVADNGIGFDQKYTDRVFEVFQRLHGRGEYEGTGIGLAICRKIVQRHGGGITARSREGEGATFVIDLPAAAA